VVAYEDGATHSTQSRGADACLASAEREISEKGTSSSKRRGGEAYWQGRNG